MRWRLALLCLACIGSTVSWAAGDRQVRTRDYVLSVSPRTPDQIGAFYEARGFPRTAIDKLRQQCYLTVYFHNTSQDVIWVELQDWTFRAQDREVVRLDRAYWSKVWAQTGLEPRFQSTFRWTLLPESLDYRPDEREGGNLILPYTTGPITLHATIRQVGPQGERRIPITLESIQCAR